MTDNFRLNFGVSLSVLAFSCFEPSQSLAQTCTVPPTCESMGYNKTASQCGNLATLKCPFDETKLFCTAFTDSEGNSIMAVGDILYSDGSFSTEPIANKKPIGVIFDISGLAVATKPADTIEKDCNTKENTFRQKCTSYSDYNITGWSLPNIHQITAIYNNKDIIDSKLAKIIAASQLGNKKYGISTQKVDAYTHITYMSFSDGTTGQEISCSTRFDVGALCVLDRATLLTTPTVTSYAVGDAYKDSNGNIIGTVVAITNNGKNGTIAYAEGSGTASEAGIKCSQKTTGGKSWTLASGANTCTLIKTSGNYSSCGYSSIGNITCGAHASEGQIACSNGQGCFDQTTGISGGNRKSCDVTDNLTYVCSTTF